MVVSAGGRTDDMDFRNLVENWSDPLVAGRSATMTVWYLPPHHSLIISFWDMKTGQLNYARNIENQSCHTISQS
jgi:hypothetical protein